MGIFSTKVRLFSNLSSKKLIWNQPIILNHYYLIFALSNNKKKAMNVKCIHNEINDQILGQFTNQNNFKFDIIAKKRCLHFYLQSVSWVE